MSIKILYVLPHLGKGGAEELIVKLTSELSIKNDVTLLLFFRIIEAEYNLSRLPKNVKVCYVLDREISFLSMARRLFTLFLYVCSPLVAFFVYTNSKVYSYNIVHINLTLPSVYLIFFKTLSKLFGTKERYIQTFHTNIHLLKGISKYLNMISWKFSDCFVYEIYEKEIEKFKPVLKSNQMDYIPFGYCKKDQKTNGQRKEQYPFLEGIADDYKIFMTISRVRFFEKKIDVMIKAMALYKECNDKFIFIIAGDGEDMFRAKQLTCELGLESHVKFVGYVDNPEFLSSFSDIFMVAVVGENTGISGMQAISNRKNVIGIQTIVDYKDDSATKMLSAYAPDGVARILYQFDSNIFAEEYKLSMSKIAEKNCINDIQFSKRYLSLYSNILSGHRVNG